MGSFSIFHWLLVLAVILILFGAGKLPSVMGDMAKGIKAFRAGLKDDAEKTGEGAVPAAAPAPVPAVAAPTAQPTEGHASPVHAATPGEVKPPTA